MTRSPANPPPARCPRAFLLTALTGLFALTLASSPPRAVGSEFADAGNPTGNAGQFNGNVTSGGSYDPLTGNATRTITDLTVPGSVGAYPLVFARIANSRYVGGLSSLFGDGGNWRHNFQYELRNQGSGKLLTYPDGRNVTFSVLSTGDNRYVDTAVKPPSTLLYGTSGTRDRLDNADANHPVLRMADGGQVQFGSFVPAGTGTAVYRPILITDPYGQSTLIQYWANDSDWIHYVVEPGGRYLQIDWLPPYQGAPKATLAGVTAWNGQNVTYTYGQQGSYVVLTGARYTAEASAANPNVNVAATYEYQGDVSGGAPLLARCFDPHFPGPMWAIRYAYDSSQATGGWGRIAQEQNANSGAVVTTLSIPVDGNNTPQHDESGGKVRQETRGDRAEDDGVNANPLVRSFGYWPTSNFLHYVTDYAGRRETRQYDRGGYLATVNDRRNNQTVFVNEPHIGQPLQVTLPPDSHGVSHARKLEYSDSLHPYYLTFTREQAGANADPNSADWRNTAYDRDGRNRVWRIRYPDGGYEQFAFDDSSDGCGQVSVHRLASGGSVSYVYGHSAAGSRGLLLSQTENDGAGWSTTTNYAYDGLDRLQTVTDARNNRTVLAYNGRHQVVQVNHPDAPIRQRYPDGQNGVNYVSFTYDDQGNRTSSADECGHVNRVTYDDYRRPVLTQDALGHCVFLSYERRRKSGPVIANADTHTRAAWTTMMSPAYADGTTRYKHSFRAYDAFFRPVSETTGLGGTDSNWPNVVSGGDSGRSNLAYDVDGNPVSTTDAMGRVTSYAVDSRGRRTSMTLPADGQFTRTYSYDYDGVGNLLQETRPSGGGRTLYAYDAMNRRYRSQDPADHVTQTLFSYRTDTTGTKLTTIDPNNNAYVSVTDGLGRPVRMNYPGGSSEAWHYDSVGNVDTFTNRAGQVQTRTYDNRHWMTQSAWNTGGRTVANTYYADGQILYANTNTGSSLCFWRDAAGKVTTEKQSPDAGLAWVDVISGYDDDNTRTAVTYPGGDALLYRYNDRGQLARQYFNNNQAAFLSNVINPDGRSLYRFRASQLHTEYHFDQGARLTYLNLFYGTLDRPRGGIDYGYDALTRRQWSQRREDGRGDRYSYGVDDQVGFVNQEALNTNTTPTGDLRQSGFAYDAAGNRTASNTVGANSAGNVNYTNTDGLNRYLTLNGANVGYDANSNLTYEPLSGSSYFYDADNRLTRAVCPQTGVDRSYGYDALGRCVWRQDNGGAKSYLLYNGANLIEERVGGYSTRANRYVHGAGTDEPVLLARADGTTLYYHQDANGNVVALSDTAANVVERYHYDPFGRPLVCDGAGAENRGDGSPYGNRFLFTGRLWESAVKLYDYRARTYSPSLGRFLQADPIGFGGGNHLYRYCVNDSVGKSDPSGLWTFQIGVTFNGQGGPVSGTVSSGLIFDGSGRIGTYATGGGGVGMGARFSGGISLAGSNGDSINDVAGPFWYGGVSAGAGANASIDGFAGPGSRGQPIGGGGITAGAGGGAGGATGGTNTTVTQIATIPDLIHGVVNAASSLFGLLKDEPGARSDVRDPDSARPGATQLYYNTIVDGPKAGEAYYGGGVFSSNAAYALSFGPLSSFLNGSIASSFATNSGGSFVPGITFGLGGGGDGGKRMPCSQN